jgi:hypothetical protein
MNERNYAMTIHETRKERKTRNNRSTSQKYRPRTLAEIRARIALANRDDLYDEPVRMRLRAALADRDAVGWMMDCAGFKQEDIADVLDHNGTFPVYRNVNGDLVSTGFGVLRKSDKTGLYRGFIRAHHQTGKRVPKPLWTHLGEIYAVRRFGAQWRGQPQHGDLHSGRLPPQVRNMFLWRLAHISGAAPVVLSLLPSLPTNVVSALQSEAEVAYAATLVVEFGLLRDLVREHLPRAYRASVSKAGTFSQSFRRLLFADDRHGLIAQIERDARARAKANGKRSAGDRVDQIWKLLAPHKEHSVDGVILRLRTGFSTLYRWGFAERQMQDEEMMEDALRRWKQQHEASPA